MNVFLLVWLVLAAVFAGLYYALPARRALWRPAFAIAMSAFVAHTLILTVMKQGGLARSEPAMDTDRGELMLRMSSSFEVLKHKVMGSIGENSPELPGQSKIKAADPYDEAAKALEEALNKRPDSWLLESKLSIVLGDRGRHEDHLKLSKIAQSMAASKLEAQHLMGQAILATYSGKPISENHEKNYAATFEHNLPEGWYRDAAMLHLYKMAADKKHFETLTAQVEDHAIRLLTNMLIVIGVGSIASLIGILTIFIQLLLVSRKGVPSAEPFSPPWTFSTVYTIFIGWMATQILIGSIVQKQVASMHLLTSGGLNAALATAGLYLASNGPGLFYIYWFACRPHAVRFTQAVGLTLHSGKNGPVRLVLLGVITWCAAIPVVAISYLLAIKFMGSEGSSNPVISLVLEAARSSNPLAAVVFYLTLGVLAPICEETLFRGFIYRGLRKYVGVGTALFASAALFAAVHFDAGALVPLFCLGWLFGYVFERTKSLVPSMVAHGIWNSVTFTLVLLIFGS